MDNDDISKEYYKSDETQDKTSEEKNIEKPNQETISTSSKYGIAKPQRIKIRGKIINDQS